MKVARYTLAAALLAAAGSANAALITTSNSNGTALVNALLGSGVTVSNIVYTGASSTASGTFTGGSTIGGGGLGFDSGVLLTTGTVNCAPGPNDSTACSDSSGAKTSLKFDFTSATGDLFFNYVFASEEYNEWVNSIYNDTFKLLLDGKNIALVPGTNDEVTVNNVNAGKNAAYFKNNSPGPYDLQYDGLTTMLTATATGLVGVHTFEFLIEDFGDTQLDSGVFIQAGSFSSEPPPTGVPEPTTLALLGAGLLALGSKRLLRRKT